MLLLLMVSVFATQAMVVQTTLLTVLHVILIVHLAMLEGSLITVTVLLVLPRLYNMTVTSTVLTIVQMDLQMQAPVYLLVELLAYGRPS